MGGDERRPAGFGKKRRGKRSRGHERDGRAFHAPRTSSRLLLHYSPLSPDKRQGAVGIVASTVLSFLFQVQLSMKQYI